MKRVKKKSRTRGKNALARELVTERNKNESLLFFQTEFRQLALPVFFALQQFASHSAIITKLTENQTTRNYQLRKRELYSNNTKIPSIQYF